MIQSVNRALDIMSVISDNQGIPMTISQIAKKTSLNQSTCCHIVETLAARGFLNQVSRSSGYVLGMYSYTLTRYKSFHSDLILVATPIIKWLESKTGYTSLLANMVDGEKFVLAYAESPENSLKYKGDLYKGTLYDSATGRAMLSTMRLSELKTAVEKSGLPTEEEWKDTNTLEKLVMKLNKLSKEKVVKVFSQEKNIYYVKFAVAFTGPKSRRYAIGLDLRKKTEPTKEEIDYIDKLILAAAHEINRRMKFSEINKE